MNIYFLGIIVVLFLLKLFFPQHDEEQEELLEWLDEQQLHRDDRDDEEVGLEKYICQQLDIGKA